MEIYLEDKNDWVQLSSVELHYFSKIINSINFGDEIKNNYALIKENNKFGFIKNNLEIPYPPQFDEARMFTEICAVVFNNNKWGIVYRDYSQIIYFDIDKSDYDLSDFINEVSIVDIYIEGENPKTYQTTHHTFYGLINLNGNVALPIEYNKISRVENSNYLLLRKNGLFGVYCSISHFQLPSIYCEIKFTKQNTVWAKKQKYIGPIEYDIDEDGKVFSFQDYEIINYYFKIESLCWNPINEQEYNSIKEDFNIDDLPF